MEEVFVEVVNGIMLIFDAVTMGSSDKQQEVI